MIGEGIYPRDPMGKLDCKDTPPDLIHDVLAAEDAMTRRADEQAPDGPEEVLKDED